MFTRSLQEPKLTGSPDGRYVLISQGGASPLYYLVDVEKKSRRRIDEVPFDGLRWVGGQLVFEEQKGDERTVFLFDPENSTKTAIPAVHADLVTNDEKGEILFVSSSKYMESGSVGPSISYVIEEAKRQTLEPKIGDARVFITQRRNNGDYRTISEIEVKKGERIERLTFDKNAQGFYFEKGGKLFKLALMPESL